LLLVLEAGLAGTIRSFFGVSLFFNPIFFLGEGWGKTTSSGSVCSLFMKWGKMHSLEGNRVIGISSKPVIVKYQERSSTQFHQKSGNAELDHAYLLVWEFV
jgi:hypothetical protein